MPKEKKVLIVNWGSDTLRHLASTDKLKQPCMTGDRGAMKEDKRNKPEKQKIRQVDKDWEVENISLHGSMQWQENKNQDRGYKYDTVQRICIGHTRGRGIKTHGEELEKKEWLTQSAEESFVFLFESVATVYCPTVHMFPSIEQLSVGQSCTIGTWINLCQQTRAHRPNSLCGLMQSLCRILPPHAQPHISTVSYSVSAF